MTLIKTSSALLLFVLATAGVTAALVIDGEPQVTQSSTLTPTELRRARQFVREVLAVNRSSSTPTTLSLSESDTEILFGQVLENLRGGHADVEYGPGSLRLRLTAGLPRTPFGRYANLDLTLLQQQEQLVLDQLQLGSLVLPGWLADRLLQRGHALLQQQLPEYAMLLGSIDGFTLAPGQLDLRYTLTVETLDQLSARGSKLLFSPDTSERLQAHAAFLAELEASFGDRRNVSLAEVLGPMFRFAGERGGDAAEENRAVLLVLALHQMDMNPARLLQGSAATGAAGRRLRFTLYRRRDYAQHFLGSAVLAVSIEPGLADTIALLKEMDDAQEGGSGFSFTDLAADIAGIRFAAAAVEDGARAARVQALMGSNTDEGFFLFDVRDLPEFLDEDAFRSTYGDTGSAAYQRVLDSIDSGIASSGLYRTLAP